MPLNVRTDQALVRLLAASLEAWNIDGAVQHAHEPADGGAVALIRTDGADIAVGRAPAGMPFRWTVRVGERVRTAASVVGVLRIVRQAVAADYTPMPLRVAAMPAKEGGVS